MSSIFRATEHGFKVGEFHKRVDEKDDILYLIKTEHNRTFGGYYKVKLTKQSQGKYSTDKDAFIIQIDD